MNASLGLRLLTREDLPSADSVRALAGWNQTIADFVSLALGYHLPGFQPFGGVSSDFKSSGEARKLVWRRRSIAGKINQVRLRRIAHAEQAGQFEFALRRQFAGCGIIQQDHVGAELLSQPNSGAFAGMERSQRCFRLGRVGVHL